MLACGIISCSPIACSVELSERNVYSSYDDAGGSTNPIYLSAAESVALTPAKQLQLAAQEGVDLGMQSDIVIKPSAGITLRNAS